MNNQILTRGQKRTRAEENATSDDENIVQLINGNLQIYDEFEG